MRYLAEYLMQNYSTLLLLSGLAVIMLTNRGLKISGMRYVWGIMGLVLLLTVLSYLEDWTLAYHHGIGWLYLKTSLTYLIYPLLLLVEVFLIAKPNKLYAFFLLLPYSLFIGIEVGDLFGAGLTYFFHSDYSFAGGPLRPIPMIISVLYLIVLALESLMILRRGRRSHAVIVGFVTFSTLLTVILEYTDTVTDHIAEMIAFEMIVYSVYLAAVEYTRMHRNMHKQEMELEKSKLALMLAQIKPHFINNALLAIRETCYDDPERAAELIDHFSAYLRNNLSASDNGRLIPFLQEMEAVKEYLALEYADETKQFHVEYDLQFTDFHLPQLSIEPLVENALKHGVDRYSPDSCVLIRSYKRDSTAVVEIRDNGAGFEANPETLGKDGIGLKNTVSRLQLMCNGTLDVYRRDGWTVVVIGIPLERR